MCSRRRTISGVLCRFDTCMLRYLGMHGSCGAGAGRPGDWACTFVRALRRPAGRTASGVRVIHIGSGSGAGAK